MPPKGACRLLYFVKSKNGTKCKNFAGSSFIAFLCQYIHSYIFPEMAEGGAVAPLATPLNLPLIILLECC